MTEHVPCTDCSHFYYLEKKLSFTKQEEVKKRAAQAAKKKKPFLFHWRGGYLTREILKELLIGIEEAAKEKGKQAKVSLRFLLSNNRRANEKKMAFSFWRPELLAF